MLIDDVMKRNNDDVTGGYIDDVINVSRLSRPLERAEARLRPLRPHL
jgi:hypothetical protein